MSDDSILATYVTEIAGPEVAAPPPKFFQRLNRLSQLLGQYPIPEAGDACVLVQGVMDAWIGLALTAVVRRPFGIQVVGEGMSTDARIRIVDKNTTCGEDRTVRANAGTLSSLFCRAK